MLPARVVDAFALAQEGLDAVDAELTRHQDRLLSLSKNWNRDSSDELAELCAVVEYTMYPRLVEAFRVARASGLASASDACAEAQMLRLVFLVDGCRRMTVDLEAERAATFDGAEKSVDGLLRSAPPVDATVDRGAKRASGHVGEDSAPRLCEDGATAESAPVDSRGAVIASGLGECGPTSNGAAPRRQLASGLLGGGAATPAVASDVEELNALWEAHRRLPKRYKQPTTEAERRENALALRIYRWKKLSCSAPPGLMDRVSVLERAVEFQAGRAAE